MTIYRLTEDLIFPPPWRADAEGLLAVGGDLRPERLLLAYACGIFPWYEDGLPILWHSPDPRMVLEPGRLRISRSLGRSIRAGGFHLTMDRCFRQVMERCALVARRGQEGTWITGEMIEGYSQLHEQGLAHSVETWRGGRLVGGLYGVSLGRAFFGESMFAEETDASKVAMVYLVRQIERWGIRLVDCQIYTDHLAGFGAELWPRRRFLAALHDALSTPARLGTWAFDAGFDPLSSPGVRRTVL